MRSVIQTKRRRSRPGGRSYRREDVGNRSSNQRYECHQGIPRLQKRCIPFRVFLYGSRHAPRAVRFPCLLPCGFCYSTQSDLVLRSHNITVPSPLPLAIVCPSGLNAMLLTVKVCAFKLRMGSPVCASHRSTVLP